MKSQNRYIYIIGFNEGFEVILWETVSFARIKLEKLNICMVKMNLELYLNHTQKLIKDDHRPKNKIFL